jgi:predicted phosphodiesterase
VVRIVDGGGEIAMVLIDDKPGAEREAPPETPAEQRRSRRLRVPLRLLAVLAVIAATITGGYLALVTFHQERTLSAGTIRLSVSPGHRGALDIYVPLVDWGARFEAIRLPARLRVDLRTIDRGAVARVANGGSLDVHEVRVEARNEIAAYLRTLIGVVFVCSLLLGVLVALAVRGGPGPPLKVTLSIAGGTAIAGAVALIVLLPPRGQIDQPQYYAHGPDIPRALQAVESVQRSGAVLDQELDAQLVGLARLVTAPGDRTTIIGRPDITVASDLHNNTLGVEILARNAHNGPVFFTGDLTDRGSPLETRLTERIVHTGHPFVFVSGNHDSDSLSLRLAREGAIVLTENGRLKPDGSHGEVVAKVAGLRVAGYSDPFERRSSEDFADRYDNKPTLQQQGDFTAWLRKIENRVDVVMVHEPALIEPAIRGLDEEQPDHPIVFLVGHTHKADLQRFGDVTVLNSGSIGAGGTGNLTEGTPYALGRLVYDAKPTFLPRAADIISINPGTGSSTARRERLDDTPAR